MTLKLLKCGFLSGITFISACIFKMILGKSLLIKKHVIIIKEVISFHFTFKRIVIAEWIHHHSFYSSNRAGIHLLWSIAHLLLIHLKLHFIVSILNSNSVIIMNELLASKNVYLLFSICFSCSFTLLGHLGRSIINQEETLSVRYLFLYTGPSKKST